MSFVGGVFNRLIGWKNDLTRTAILLGKSANTNDIARAFLWNMIAFELLLTQQGGSYSKVLPIRAKAFVDWLDAWTDFDWAQKIARLYDLRCRFVHDGNAENISIPDLLFADQLIRNIFGNILRNVTQFGTRQAVIEFSEKIAAQEILGLEDTLRPSSFQFWSLVYDEADYAEI